MARLLPRTPMKKAAPLDLTLGTLDHDGSEMIRLALDYLRRRPPSCGASPSGFPAGRGPRRRVPAFFLSGKASAEADPRSIRQERPPW